LWHFATFQTVTMSHFWTLWQFQVFVTWYVFFEFFSKIKINITQNVEKSKCYKPKAFMWLFQTFRKYLWFQASFRLDKPKNRRDTGHVYDRARGKRRGASRRAPLEVCQSAYWFFLNNIWAHSGWQHQPGWAKKGKKKIFWYPAQNNPSPGRIDCDKLCSTIIAICPCVALS